MFRSVPDTLRKRIVIEEANSVWSLTKVLCIYAILLFVVSIVVVLFIQGSPKPIVGGEVKFEINTGNQIFRKKYLSSQDYRDITKAYKSNEITIKEFEEKYYEQMRDYYPIRANIDLGGTTKVESGDTSIVFLEGNRSSQIGDLYVDIVAFMSAETAYQEGLKELNKQRAILILIIGVFIALLLYAYRKYTIKSLEATKNGELYFARGTIVNKYLSYNQKARLCNLTIDIEGVMDGYHKRVNRRLYEESTKGDEIIVVKKNKLMSLDNTIFYEKVTGKQVMILGDDTYMGKALCHKICEGYNVVGISKADLDSCQDYHYEHKTFDFSRGNIDGLFSQDKPDIIINAMEDWDGNAEALNEETHDYIKSVGGSYYLLVGYDHGVKSDKAIYENDNFEGENKMINKCESNLLNDPKYKGAIVRHSYVLHKESEVIKKVKDAIKTKNRLLAPKNQFVNCIDIDDFCAMFFEIIKHNASGIFHLTSVDFISLYDFYYNLSDEVLLKTETLEDKVYDPAFGRKRPELKGFSKTCQSYIKEHDYMN